LRAALFSAIALFVASRLVAVAVPVVAEIFYALPFKNKNDRIIDLADKVVGLLEPTGASVSDAFDAISKARPDELMLLAIIMSMLAYILLWPTAASFGIKRMLFNLYPAFGDRQVTPGRWSLRRSQGIYSLEKQLFADLGTKPPQEPPFDLVVGSVGLLILLGPALDAALFGLQRPVSFSNLSSSVAFLLLFFAGYRWLWRTWRWRLDPGRADVMPFWFRLTAAGIPIKVDSPWPIFLWPALLVVAAVGDTVDQVNHYLESVQQNPSLYLLIDEQVRSTGVMLGVFSAPWLYRVSRELKSLGLAEGAPMGKHPLIAALFVSAGWSAGWFAVLPLLAGYQLASDVSAAERLVGVRGRPLPSAVVALAMLPPAFPFVAAYLQRRLNRIWVSVGQGCPRVPPVATPRMGCKKRTIAA
jgi:hypothetical protein